MPKTTSTRTFAGCWTCRRRNVRCDTQLPKCSPCKRSNLACEGYHVRLAWVDPVSGEYTPCRRRTYPSHLTWANHPNWTSREIDHLISQCDQGHCRCRLHQPQSPFSSFQLYSTRENDNDDNKGGIISFPTDLDPQPCEERSLLGDSSSSLCTSPPADVDIVTSTDVECSNSTSPCPSYDLQVRGRTIDLSKVSHEVDMNDFSDSDESIHLYRYSYRKMGPSIVSPTQMPGRNSEEIRLLHHYVAHVSTLMVPVDGVVNPWKSTYLAIGSQTATSAARALFSATLAQAALHLAHLKGPGRGTCEEAHAVRYIGLAIKELRMSLYMQTDDYTSVLAALLALISVQHIFQNNSHGWRDHYRGAIGFVSQYLNKRPWLISWDAWIVTQSFVLGIIFAETADCSPNVINTDITQVRDLLMEMMIEPEFGCTVGGHARHLEAIHQIRLLEEQIAQSGNASNIQAISPEMLERVCQIIERLQILPDDELQTCHTLAQMVDQDSISPAQTLVKLHLQLFDGAVMIHLCRVVLRCPPSAITGIVQQVLSSVITFSEMGGGPVSAWPIVIAAAEACTDEAQALAIRYFNHSEKVFAGNRIDMHRVVRQVWADRDALAVERHCNPGDIQLDWRDVMRRLDIDFLLL